jgi:AcrR family transcriptional regulator
MSCPYQGVFPARLGLHMQGSFFVKMESGRLRKRTVTGMGRRQVFTRSELLDHAKRMLLEQGYEGFQLKSLSTRLPGARSTIYQYFANKEEIIAACMRRVMEDVLQQAQAVDETDCMEALKQLLKIYLREAGFHQLIGYAHKINKSNSPATAEDLEFVEQAHFTLLRQIERLLVRARKEGRISPDIPLPAVTGVFINLINTPNLLNIPLPEWSEMLFRLWLEGAGNRNARNQN